MKSAAKFLLIHLIVSMTLYLPVWHCSRARFTVLVSCNDEIAVRSCPLLCLQRQVEADKILQQRSSNLVAGYGVINSIIAAIGKLRNDAEFEKMLQKLPLQLSHPPNKRKKSLSSRCGEDVISPYRNLQWKWQFEFETSLLGNHWYYSSEFNHRFSEFSLSLIKSLRALSPAWNCFLGKERITTSLFFIQFNYQKYQWRSSRCWNYLWKALSHQSFLLCFWINTPVWFWNSF